MAKFRLGLQVSPFQAHYITGEKASGLGNVLVGPAGVDHEPIHATMQQLTTTNTIPLAQPSPAQQEVEVQDVSKRWDSDSTVARIFLKKKKKQALYKHRHPVCYCYLN
jgi:hypothetical protein